MQILPECSQLRFITAIFLQPHMVFKGTKIYATFEHFKYEEHIGISWRQLSL